MKLNKDKTQFTWLGTPHQLSKLDCQTITRGGVAIKVSSESMCLGVLLDSTLTFAPYVRRLSGKCFYHLRQLKIVRRSLSEAAAKTMIHAFITSRIDYCNSVLHVVSAVHLRPLQNVLNQRRVSYFGNRDAITLLRTFATSSTCCQFNRGSSTRRACLYTSISQHPSTFPS